LALDVREHLEVSRLQHPALQRARTVRLEATEVDVDRLGSVAGPEKRQRVVALAPAHGVLDRWAPEGPRTGVLVQRCVHRARADARELEDGVLAVEQEVDKAATFERHVPDVYSVRQAETPGVGSTTVGFGELDPAARRADSREGIRPLEDPHGNTALVLCGIDLREIGAVRR